jgi:hypothetical protein
LPNNGFQRHEKKCSLSDGDGKIISLVLTEKKLWFPSLMIYERQHPISANESVNVKHVQKIIKSSPRNSTISIKIIFHSRESVLIVGGRDDLKKETREL